MRSNNSSHIEPTRPAQQALPWDLPPGLLMAGVDEAGRGPLAGPVLAAAVILDPTRPIACLADSKQLSARQRERLYEQIVSNALCFSVAEASIEEIDHLNILQASLLAMQRAVADLRPQPEWVLVDGKQLPRLPMRAEAIVRGDVSVPAIAAASILAKVTRDRLCLAIDAHYPQYGFAIHKGYGTAMHLAALAEHGPCAWHRRTFAPVARLLRGNTEANQGHRPELGGIQAAFDFDPGALLK